MPLNRKNGGPGQQLQKKILRENQQQQIFQD